MMRKLDVTGDDIKALRKRCGLTQDSVAEKLGVRRQTLGNWEKGVGDPSSGAIFTMLRLFGIKSLNPMMDEIKRIVQEEEDKL